MKCMHLAHDEALQSIVLLKVNTVLNGGWKQRHWSQTVGAGNPATV